MHTNISITTTSNDPPSRLGDFHTSRARAGSGRAPGLRASCCCYFVYVAHVVYALYVACVVYFFDILSLLVLLLSILLILILVLVLLLLLLSSLLCYLCLRSGISVCNPSFLLQLCYKPTSYKLTSFGPDFLGRCLCLGRTRPLRIRT